MKTTKLIGKRIILRKPTLKDAKDIVETTNDRDIAKYMLSLSYPYTLKDAKKYINNYKKHPYNFLITLKKTGKVIGSVDFASLDDSHKIAHIGWVMDKRYQGQGYAKEATKLLIDFAFKKLKLHKLIARIHEKNIASQRLAKSVGLKQEAILRKNRKDQFTGKWVDEVYYGLLREDWKKRKIK